MSALGVIFQDAIDEDFILLLTAHRLLIYCFLRGDPQGNPSRRYAAPLQGGAYAELDTWSRIFPTRRTEPLDLGVKRPVRGRGGAFWARPGAQKALSVLKCIIPSQVGKSTNS